jgi:hypothetical protein
MRIKNWLIKNDIGVHFAETGSHRGIAKRKKSPVGQTNIALVSGSGERRGGMDTRNGTLAR